MGEGEAVLLKEQAFEVIEIIGFVEQDQCSLILLFFNAPVGEGEIIMGDQDGVT
jgi:hypothetical protein